MSYIGTVREWIGQFESEGHEYEAGNLSFVGQLGAEPALFRVVPAQPHEVSLASVPPTGVAVPHVFVEGSEAPPWLGYVTGRLTDMARLWVQPDPDVPTPGTRAFERSLVEIRRVMHEDTPAPSVIVTVDGNILFTWRQPHSTVEIEVGPEETEVWAERYDGDEEIEGDLTDWKDEIDSFIFSTDR